MTAETLQILSLIFYILAGVLLLVGIALYFLLDIRRVWGRLSGATERKEIANIHRQNENTGNRINSSKPFHPEQGRLTDKITLSGRLERKPLRLNHIPGTEKFNTVKLTPQMNDTTLLASDTNATGVLTQDNRPSVPNPPPKKFSVDFEMGFLGSTEFIE